ncbi:MAG: hypothetical protein ACFBWO_17455 [Paracoccaceae bacterium]
MRIGPFETLGLDARTADRKAVRAAYAALVKGTRPEDDPARFQRLREARDAALERLSRGAARPAPSSGAAPARIGPASPAPEPGVAVEPPAAWRGSPPVAPAPAAPPRDVPPPAMSPDETPAPVARSSVTPSEATPSRSVEPAPEAPRSGWFDDWDWERAAPRGPASGTDGDAGPGGEAPADARATPEADAAALAMAEPDLEGDGVPPLGALAIAAAEIDGAPLDPGPWTRAERAVDRLALDDTKAVEFLLGDPVRKLAAEPEARVPVETARVVARLAEQLGWARAGGLFDRLERDEARRMMHLVGARARDRTGGRVVRGLERDENGIPTIAPERVRPWLEPYARGYVDAFARAQARGRWPRRLSVWALLFGLAWAARRRAVGAYFVLIPGYAAAACLFGVLSEMGGMEGAMGWTILGGYFLSNLRVALSADRFAVESAARRARDPRAAPEGGRNLVYAMVIGYFGMKATLTLGVVASLMLWPLLEPWLGG